MNRRDFLKLAAALPVASVLPAAARTEYPWIRYGLSVRTLEQAVEDVFHLSKDRGLISVRPTRLIVPASLREASAAILNKCFDDAIESLPGG